MSCSFRKEGCLENKYTSPSLAAARSQIFLQSDKGHNFRKKASKLNNIFMLVLLYLIVFILKVRFESGPIGAQDVEIRVTDTPVENNQV